MNKATAPTRQRAWQTRGIVQLFREGLAGVPPAAHVGTHLKNHIVDKLLLIDDEADVQYSFRRIFDSAEIELTTAASGEEGLRIIPRLKPDLVIMDVRMGGLNGLETLRRLRQSDAKLPVIMMTAYGTTQTAIEAMTFR